MDSSQLSRKPLDALTIRLAPTVLTYSLPGRVMLRGLASSRRLCSTLVTVLNGEQITE
jgi:hypothetical protein